MARSGRGGPARRNSAPASRAGRPADEAVANLASSRRAADGARPPGQIVLVLQGGGALGAFQAGVYEALEEAGLAPDWVIGTSIGAINAGLILRDFWRRIAIDLPWPATPQSMPLVNAGTMLRGVDGFFSPSVAPWWGPYVGVERASFYDTAPLRRTLAELIDAGRLSARSPRLTVGAVNARNGEMRYFDSRDEALGIDHLLASGALPPAFPAVRIGGEPYWDGGIYSNTPIEAVLDDRPRRTSTIFAVQLWHPSGDEPESLWQVMGRQKEIEYSSRADSHIARQQQIHRLRHVINELARHVPELARRRADVSELCSYGCRTVMHIVRLMTPRLAHDDQTKDIDFTAEAIAARWKAGLADARAALAAAPWREPVDPLQGVTLHDFTAAGR